MNAVINLFPAILYLLAIIPFCMISMNRKKAAENQKILTERHAQNAAE